VRDVAGAGLFWRLRGAFHRTQNYERPALFDEGRVPIDGYYA
jgi:hypothetical protein